MSVAGLTLVFAGLYTFYTVLDAAGNSHLNNPCYNAKPLHHLDQRVVGYKLRPGEEPVSDGNLTDGWYSFGDYYLASPNTPECGTNVSWHRKGILPLDYGLHTTEVCGGNNCAITQVSYVNRCPGGHFVFFLRTLAGDGEAYCVEDPATTSSNYSRDPCYNAKPLDHLDQRVVGYTSQPGEQLILDGNLPLGWYSVGDYVLASPNSSDCGTNVSWHRTDTLSLDYGLHAIDVYGGDNTTNTDACNSQRCPAGHFVFFLKPLAKDGGGAYCVEDAQPDDPCDNAKPLDHLDQRVVGYKSRSGEQPVSDVNLTDGWYSVGNYVLASPNSTGCGTNVSWHRKGFLQMDYDLHESDVCRGDSCNLTKVSYSTRCRDGNFVFFLRPLADAEAYCVEDPVTTLTNYSKDPCFIAKPLDHLAQRVVGYTNRPGEQMISDGNLTLGWYSVGNHVLASPNSSDCGTNVSWHRTDTLPGDPGVHTIDVYGGDDNTTTKQCISKKCPGGQFVFYLLPLATDGGGAYCVEDQPVDQTVTEASKKTETKEEEEKTSQLWIIGAVLGPVALLVGLLTPLILLFVKKMKNQTKVEDVSEKKMTQQPM